MWSTLFITPTKTIFIRHRNCNALLTGPRFVFSRDISTSRYRCVCKSMGIILRCERQIINIRWIKNVEIPPDNGHSGCHCWQWYGQPHDIFPSLVTQPPYMHMYISHAFCDTTALAWYSLSIISLELTKFKFLRIRHCFVHILQMFSLSK